MQKILVPCDGSKSALHAVQYAASLAKSTPGMQLDLLHVLDPVTLREHAALTVQELDQLQADEAEHVLHPARQILDGQGVPYQVHWRAGAPANEIAHHVRDVRCDAVIMGTRGMTPVAGAMIGSVATKVVHLVDVPVTLIK